MKNQTLILLLIAGACGLVAMLGVKKYLDKQNDKEEKPTATVLTAMAPIAPGTPLDETNTQFVTVDAESCPEGAVTDLEQITDRASKVTRGPGDWILVQHLGEPGATGAVTKIPTGYRVATIPVDATTNHSGMLQPGNRIDLMLTYEARDQETGERVTRVVPLLEYIEVFAVDATQYGVDKSGENAQARNISLLVTLEQNARLMLAKREGDITTVLRSSEDKDAIAMGAVDESTLFGVQTGGVDETSSRDNGAGEFGFAMPEEDSKPKDDIASRLLAEVNGPGGSGPVMGLGQEKESDDWVMAIHSTSGIRVEHVSQVSDVPIDTSASAVSTPVVDIPAGAIPGVEPKDLPTEETLGGLTEMAEGLLEDLF